MFVGECNQGGTKDPVQGGLAACRGGRGQVGRGPGAPAISHQLAISTPRRVHEDKEIDSKPKGETGAIEVPGRKRVKRGPTTGRTRRSRSLVKSPDLRLTIEEYQCAVTNS